MTRRNGIPADSLELLLDTICNTFGGIIFIALLVVVLLMISGKREDPRSLPSDVVNAAAAKDQLESLLRLKDRLESSLEKQSRVVSTLTQEDRSQNLATYQYELARNSQLEAEISVLKEQIGQSQKEDEEIARRMKELRSKQATIEEQSTHLQQSLAQQKSARRKTLRMPVVRSAGQKQEITVVIQFNRLYFWHRYSPDGNKEGLNWDDFLVLSENAEGVVTSPNPNCGLPVEGTSESQLQMVQSLKRFRPSNSYLAIVVRPDSYGSFQHFRNAAVASGFEYRLIPATSEDRFVDRGGKGGFVQ
jgi:hypothetical protein